MNIVNSQILNIIQLKLADNLNNKVLSIILL